MRLLQRSRALYLSLAIVTIVLGLASRHYRSELPAFIGAYAGDTLWALMVFLAWAIVWRRASGARIALGAGLLAVGVEFSQLYHAPWIDGLRATRLGGLALGYGFIWSDLVCYAAGIGVGLLLDSLVTRQSRK